MTNRHSLFTAVIGIATLFSVSFALGAPPIVVIVHGPENVQRLDVNASLRPDLGVSHPLGYPVNYEHAQRTYRLSDFAASQQDIETFLRRKKPTWNLPYTRGALAQALLRTARHFGLDERVFAAMVWKESTFDWQAVSPTGALGLTQLTTPGLLEFINQAGTRLAGKNPNPAGGVAYFRDKLIEAMPGFEPARYDFPTREKQQEYARSLKESWLRTSVYAQLITGATTLKAKVAYECQRHPECTAAAMAGRDPQSQSIRRRVLHLGLQRYNGEPTKQQYADSILNTAEGI